jgi:hypothetical protein
VRELLVALLGQRAPCATADGLRQAFAVQLQEIETDCPRLKIDAGGPEAFLDAGGTGGAAYFLERPQDGVFGVCILPVHNTAILPPTFSLRKHFSL